VNYNQSIKYLEKFKRYGIRLGLERIKLLLSLLGDPQNDLKSIHIAGTNGKGSVAAMLSSILAQAGYKVGLYTSPHLVDYTERIRINEKDITGSKFAKAVSEVKKAIDRLPNLNLTTFEVLTAAAYLLLSREKVQIAVIEVGLGGRLDATNVITPVLSIITNIDRDHMDVLGNSLKKIAKEKAGIIKPKVPLVSGEVKFSGYLKNICRKNGSRYINAVSEKVSYVPLAGEHQIGNTRIALAGVKALKGLGFAVNNEQIRKGLRATYWPARLQTISKKPLIILDGAHNAAGAKALTKYLKTFGKKFTFIIGMQKNKETGKFIRIIRPSASRFIAVSSSNPYAASKKFVAEQVIACGGKAVIARDIRKAIILAKKHEDPICIAGSLYLAGDVLRILGNRR